MSKNTLISLIIVGVVVVGGAAFAIPSILNSSNNTETEQVSSTAIAKNYFDYSEDKLRSDKTNVLFFHAPWCPTCTAAENDIKRTDSIPDTINLLRIDYDSNTELRQKYDVVSQSTFVKVDASGKKIDSAQGFTTAQSIVEWALNSLTSNSETEPIQEVSTNSMNTTSPSQSNVASQTQAESPQTLSSEGRYITFAESELQADGYTSHVLFFNASWCPSCKKTEADLNANLEAIPAGVQVLKVDYDSNLALRQKYGVTSQHTFVQVNENGDKIKSQLGLATTQDIVNFIS